MATLIVWIKSILLLLPIIAASIDGNSTSYNASVQLYQEGNFTEEFVNSSTTQDEFSETTQTTTNGYTTQDDSVTIISQNVLPTEPLPLSGLLPTVVQDVPRLCPCDEQRNVCDINCCCDKECGEEVALFTSCSIHTISGNGQLCHRDILHYSLSQTAEGFSMHDSFIQKYVNADIFCIQSQNYVESFSYTLPAIPTDRNFDSLFKEFDNLPSSLWRSNDLSVTPGYQYGDLIETAGKNGDRKILQIPGAAVNTNCLATNPAAFLKEQISRCTINMVVERDCTDLQALDMHTYTDILVLSGKNENATMVPMVLTSATLKSLEDTLSPVELSPAMNLQPTLVNPTLCLNVVHQVAIVVRYNPAGELVNVSASVVLGPVHGIALSLEQEFQISFVQEEISKDRTIKRSGNPGYVTGLPVISGTRTEEGIVQSTNPIALSILQSGSNQDCLRGPHKRSPVLFGKGMVSGCTLNLEEGANCSLVSNLLLDVLRGSSMMQYVAAFGTPTLDNSLDWLPLETILISEGTSSCTLPLSHHLDIKWTKFGSLENPQSQIVSIKELIHTNSSNMALLFGGSTSVTVTTSVDFVPVSAPSEPGFQAAPTIDAKLPLEFFFPFT